MPSWYLGCTSWGSQDIRTAFMSENTHQSLQSASAYQSLLIPSDALLLVCVGVGEALYLSGLASEQTMEVRADLVAFASLQGVTLCASSLISCKQSTYAGFPAATLSKAEHADQVCEDEEKRIVP
jgi:hypothetical protein